MQALVATLPSELRDEARVKAFSEMADEVQAIKQAAQQSRLDRLREDLAALKSEDPKGWETLAKSLRG
jgi:hypothetical protein